MATYPEGSARLVIMDVADGDDIMESIANLARCKNVRVVIHKASGSIASVMLRHGSTTTTHHGPFHIVSFTGSYTYNNPHPFIDLRINLCTSQSQLFGGAVAGNVIANRVVSLTLFTFKNPETYPNQEKVNNNDNDNHKNNNNNDNDKTTLVNEFKEITVN
ncbi:hypothetical protein Fmac_026742 [Flemingia macrophylla]|uniref:PPC domain-containing protein n=1 Tax=Flemingia macrophylla TaxID=520843 RepID=A0ABD1LFP2_9FABA